MMDVHKFVFNCVFSFGTKKKRIIFQRKHVECEQMCECDVRDNSLNVLKHLPIVWKGSFAVMHLWATEKYV